MDQQCWNEVQERDQAPWDMMQEQRTRPECQKVKRFDCWPKETRGWNTTVLINGDPVEMVNNFKFLGIHIISILTLSFYIEEWSRKQINVFTCLVSEKIQHVHVNCFNILLMGYILTGYISAWFGNCSTLECLDLQRVVNIDHSITHSSLPPIQSIFTVCCNGKA